MSQIAKIRDSFQDDATKNEFDLDSTVSTSFRKIGRVQGAGWLKDGCGKPRMETFGEESEKKYVCSQRIVDNIVKKSSPCGTILSGLTSYV